MEGAVAVINAQVKTITEFMKNNGLSEPTLAADASSDIELIVELQQARTALLDATRQLEALVLGPTDYIIWNALTVLSLTYTPKDLSSHVHMYRENMMI